MVLVLLWTRLVFIFIVFALFAARPTGSALTPVSNFDTQYQILILYWLQHCCYLASLHSEMAVSADLLLGPKKPYWQCQHCHRTSNWATRIVCSCGKSAPKAVVKAAKVADKRARDAKDKSKGKRENAGAPSQDVSKLVAEEVRKVLRAELAAIKKEPEGAATSAAAPAPAPEEPAKDNSEADKAKLTSLQDFLKSLVAGKNDDDTETIAAMEKQVTALKAKVADAKPPVVQHRAIANRLQRVQASEQAVREKIDRNEAEIVKIKQAIETDRAALSEKQSEIEKLQGELQRSVALLVDAATVEGADPLAFDMDVDRPDCPAGFKDWLQNAKANENFLYLQSLWEARAKSAEPRAPAATSPEAAAAAAAASSTHAAGAAGQCEQLTGGPLGKRNLEISGDTDEYTLATLVDFLHEGKTEEAQAYLQTRSIKRSKTAQGS